MKPSALTLRSLRLRIECFHSFRNDLNRGSVGQWMIQSRRISGDHGRNVEIKKANSIIYGLLGAIAIVYGIANLVFPTFMVPEAARSFPLSHILREQAAMAIFIGCMFLWCIFNYERRAAVHYFLMVFAFLLAAIHWFDYLRGHLNWMAPLYNTVPLIVLVLMAIKMRSVPGAV